MSKASIDSSDDEEEEIVNKVQPGYFSYIVAKLIEVRDILTPQKKDPVILFDYSLGIAMQHLADRFFRHTEIGQEYKKLKSQLLEIDKSIQNNFLIQAKAFFDTQKELIQIDGTIEDKDTIQLFNHLFSDKVLLPETIIPLDSSYREHILTNISGHAELTNIIHQIFPKQILSLRQSNGTNNAAEILAFSKIVNRYIKNELKVILSNSVDSLEIDKSINFEFQKQVIRDLNESWVLRPQTRKASNKIDSLGNYDEIFQNLDETNKTNVINRIFSILCNEDITSTGIKDDQYSDKLVQLLFISELARNKAAIFTTLMFLNLLKIQDISDGKITEIIKLFPMALKGAMQSSRDLINEDKLENTHYMDFNHEGEVHTNILKAQGKLWRSCDTSLECVRKLIFLLNTESRKNLEPETFLEHVITVSEIFPMQQELVDGAKNLQKIYQEIPKKTTSSLELHLNARKSYLKEHFFEAELVSIIEKSNSRSIQTIIKKIFADKINILLAKYDEVFEASNFFDKIEQIIEQSIYKLYFHVIESYKIEGFSISDKFKLTTKTTEELLQDGNDLYNQQKYLEAINCYDMRLSQSIQTPINIQQDLVLNKGACLLALNKYNEALPYFKVIGLNSNDTDVLYNMGLCFFSLKMYEKAATCFFRVTTLCPNDAYTYHSLGLCYFNLARYVEAKKSLNQAITLYSSNPSIYNPYDIKEITEQLRELQISKEGTGINIAGQGTYIKSVDYALPYHESFNKYYSDYFEKILKLRVKNLNLCDNIKILLTKYNLSQNNTEINKILEELASLNLKDQDIALIPYNIEGKHWAGLMISKDNNNLQINYIDPENNSIPEQLFLTLTPKTKELELKSKISQIIVEQQKYNNCGPEVIENFILLLTGNRLTQEETVPFHSKLIENNLLLNNYLNNYDTEVLGHLV